jgi:hypothetical protein
LNPTSVISTAALTSTTTDAATMPGRDDVVPWRVQQHEPASFTITWDAPSRPDFEAWVLFRSDAHHDSPRNARALEMRHLDLAVERNAVICDLGDAFDAMGGKYDPRSSKDELRPEYQSGRYLDRLVAVAADHYAPYAHHWALMCEGNHESSVRRRCEVDLTRRLVETMNTATGSHVLAGQYTNLVRFQVRNGRRWHSRIAWLDHGSGGSAPVTLGTISAQRSAAMLADVDLVVQGHLHTCAATHRKKIRMNQNGRRELRSFSTLRIPGYKAPHLEAGWEAEKGFAPMPTGAWWMRLRFQGHALVTEFIFDGD